MNTDELVNPSIDLKMQKRENLLVQIYYGGMPQALVRFRVMQRPGTKMTVRSMAAEELER